MPPAPCVSSCGACQPRQRLRDERRLHFLAPQPCLSPSILSAVSPTFHTHSCLVRSVPHPSGDSSVAFLHLEAFHLEPKAGVAPGAAMTAVVEEVEDPPSPDAAAAPVAAAKEVGAAAAAAGVVAVTRGDAMWTFQFRPVANSGAQARRDTWDNGCAPRILFSLPPVPR